MFKYQQMRLVWVLIPIIMITIVGIYLRRNHLWSMPRLVLCDVGQGDAILLTKGYMQVLIDGGPDEVVLDCLEENMPWFDRQVEVVIATHLDSDHIGGLPAVLEKYQVRTILTTSQQKNTDQAKKLHDQMNKEARTGAKILVAQAGLSLEMGSLGQGTVLWPPAEKGLISPLLSQVSETTLSAEMDSDHTSPDYANAGSIVLLMEINHTKILLTGDAEASTELALRDRGVLKPIDVIKVGHHGSKSSSTTAFLAVLHPEVALIGVGAGNRYGHPDPEVLSHLVEQGMHTWRTDLHGSVELTFYDNYFKVRPRRRDQDG